MQIYDALMTSEGLIRPCHVFKAAIMSDFLSTATCGHRWAYFVNQQSLITVYSLPTKENLLPFPISICSKQTEVCCFHFSFASNKGRSLVSIFCVQGRQGTWRKGIKILGNFDVLRKKSNRKRKPRLFSLVHLLFAHRANRGLS
jgi:hypothetical protein